MRDLGSAHRETFGRHAVGISCDFGDFRWEQGWLNRYGTKGFGVRIPAFHDPISARTPFHPGSSRATHSERGRLVKQPAARISW